MTGHALVPAGGRSLVPVARVAGRLCPAIAAAFASGPLSVWAVAFAASLLGLPVYLFLPHLGFLVAGTLAASLVTLFGMTLKANLILSCLVLPAAAYVFGERGRPRTLALPAIGAVAAAALGHHEGYGITGMAVGLFGGFFAGWAFARSFWKPFPAVTKGSPA